MVQSDPQKPDGARDYGEESEEAEMEVLLQPGEYQQERAPEYLGDLTGWAATARTLRKHLKALRRVIWDSGEVCVAVAALVFSFSALFVKLMEGRIPVFQIVAVRSVLSFFTCLWGARVNNIKPFFGHRKNFHLLLSRGLFGAAAMTTYYVSISKLPLADAVTLFFFNPAITAVAAWAIMREPLGLKGLVGVGMGLAGLVLLTRPPFIFGGGGGWDGSRILGTLMGLVSAMCAAGAFISIRFIGKKEPALVMSVYFHVSAMSTSILPLCLGLPQHAVLPNFKDTALLLGVAATSFWGQILLGRGFQLVNAARASAVNFTQVVYSYILGMICLHERISLLGIIGSLLIAAGVVVVNYKPKAKSAGKGSKESTDSAVDSKLQQEEVPKVQELVAVSGHASPQSAAAAASYTMLEAGLIEAQSSSGESSGHGRVAIATSNGVVEIDRGRESQSYHQIHIAPLGREPPGGAVALPERVPVGAPLAGGRALPSFTSLRAASLIR